MRNYPDIGVLVGEILLPTNQVDYEKWAVIACDQFTSQPEYWTKVREVVGGSPSTLNMILPEVFLGTAMEEKLIQDSQVAMEQYLNQGLLIPYEGIILVERILNGKTRLGLMMALDLEKYDFNKGSQSLIRATEGTIIERLPPRIRIREGAALEIPHILVLIDDPARNIIEPLASEKASLRKLYDFDLMAGSGRLRGYLIDKIDQEARVIQGLRDLADPNHFQQKYGADENNSVLLFAAGDGNHSLATAKAIWERVKGTVGPDHPSRYALVEVENVHDEGLDFEPIHRILFGVQQDWKKSLQTVISGNVRFEAFGSAAEMIACVNNLRGNEQAIGIITEQAFEVIYIQSPSSNLPVGTLQTYLDVWIKSGGASSIDYVHGEEVVVELGRKAGNLGFFLPPMAKSDLFKTVILDGSLPRKTFSMGEAHEKRFYMESRRIT